MAFFVAMAAAAAAGALFGHSKGAVANNVSNVTVDSTVDIISNAIIDASVQVTQSQNITIDCPTYLSFISQSQYFGITSSVIQSSDFTNKVQQSLQAQFQQVANAVAQQISLGGSATANDVVNAVISAGQSISSNTILDQATTAVMSQQYSCGTGGGLYASIVRQDQIVEAVRQAVQSAATDNTSMQDLSVLISQTATAKIQSDMWIIAVVAVVLILILLIFEGGVEKIGDDAVKGAVNWKFALAIVPLVVVIIMAVLGIPPFISKKALANGKFVQVPYGSKTEPTPANCATVCAQQGKTPMCGKGVTFGASGEKAGDVIGCNAMDTWMNCWCAPCDKGETPCNGQCCPPGDVCSENQCKVAPK